MLSLTHAHSSDDVELGLMNGADVGTDLMVIGSQAATYGLREVVRANPAVSCIAVVTTLAATAGAIAALIRPGAAIEPAQAQPLRFASGHQSVERPIPTADAICSELVVTCQRLRSTTVDNFSTADIEEISRKADLLVRVVEQRIATGSRDRDFFDPVAECVNQRLRISQIKALIAHLEDLQRQLPTSGSISDMVRPAVARNLQYGIDRVRAVNVDLFNLSVKVTRIVLGDVG
jgi:hypothetical protein